MIQRPERPTTGMLSLEYYERITDGWRERYGDSFHFAIVTGNESLQEAVVATEHMIADEGEFHSGMRVLDVGCGIGGPALNIVRHSGVHVTGITIVESHLAIARQRAEDAGLSDHVDFVLADAMHMPFSDGSFDAVYIFDAGCHMPNKARFYKECARVLKPGGVFLGLDWMRSAGLSPEVDERYNEPICKYFGIPHMVTLPDLQHYLQDAGLTVNILEDASVRGSVSVHFANRDQELIAAIRDVGDMVSLTLRMEMEGGIALGEAYHAGAFIVGHWRAYKPNQPEGGQVATTLTA